ncbi:MAG: PorP/SprF family type IX secretion system membrane protein, partial [Bacteroidota bacterium]
IFLYSLSFLFLSSFYFAQDPQFSMYNENPSLLNPALCGANHVLRASISYKDQWRNVTLPYKSFGMGMDMKFKPDNWQQVDKHRGMTFKERSLSRLAAGFSIYNDKAGLSRYSSLQTNLSMAYFVPLNTKQFLSFGLQAGLFQKQIENESLVFSSQFNGNTYDKSLSSGESFNSFYQVYPDFAAGALWALQERNKRVGEYGIKRINFGMSLYHLNSAKQGFFKQKQSSDYRMNAHGEFVYLAPKASVGFSPSFNACLQGTVLYYSVGSFITYYFSENSKYTGLNKRSSLALGAFYRSGQCVTLQCLFEKSEQYALGLAYDISFSRISSFAGGKGGFELVMRYTPPMAFLYEKKQVN